jgi:hypothetical protein
VRFSQALLAIALYSINIEEKKRKREKDISVHEE